MGALSRLSKSDLSRTLAHSDKTENEQKMCSIKLHETAAAPLEIRWHGGRTGMDPSMIAKQEVYVIRQGESKQFPLGRVESLFGPFTWFERYEECADENKRDVMRLHIATEVARTLNRYDYQRGNGKGFHPDMNPTGPHRFPDITVQVLTSEGPEGAPIRLHELYEIGEWDELKDTFQKRETEAEIAERYEAMLKAKDADHLAEIARVNEKMNEVLGMVKGFVAGKEVGKTESAVEETVPA